MSLQHCTDCDFSSKTSLWNHKNSVHVGTFFSCQECAYTSRSKHGLKHHVKAKHEGDVHKCQECGKAFSYVGDLNRHKRAIHEGIVFAVLIHLLLNRTEYYQLQIVSKKLTKMHTHLCIDIRVVLLFVNRTGKLVEMSADEKSWWWLKISSTVDAEKFF